MVRRGAFSAALSAEESQANAEVRDELLALRGEVPRRWQREDELGEAKPQPVRKDMDIRDEAGFVADENDPFVYISQEKSAREEGVEYEVIHKRVAIRKTPSTDARVLGACEKGEKLQLFDWDSSCAWRRMHFRLRGGWGSLVEAWVMVRHPELGKLLRRADGLAEPESKAAPPPKEPLADPIGDAADVTAAAAALAAEAGERLRLLSSQELPKNVVVGDIERYKVIRKPFTAVRSQPSTDGLIVMTAEFGHALETFGEDDTGAWRKVFCTCTSSKNKLPDEANVKLPDAPLPAWMLVKHPELGPLLQLVEDDDNQYE